MVGTDVRRKKITNGEARPCIKCLNVVGYILYSIADSLDMCVQFNRIIAMSITV